MPGLNAAVREQLVPTFTEAGRRFQAARVDVSEATRTQHRIHLDKLIPLIGTRRIDTLEMEDFIGVVAELHAKSTARETIRKVSRHGRDGARPRRRLTLIRPAAGQISSRTRTRRDQPTERRARRSRLSPPGLPSTGCRCSSWTVQRRASRASTRPSSATTSSRTGAFAYARADDADAEAAVDRPARRARRSDRDEATTAGGRNLAGTTLCRERRATLSVPRSRELVRRLGSRCGRRTICGTGGSACSICAGVPVGADRRVRWPERSRRHGEHLHPRSLRRDRTRLCEVGAEVARTRAQRCCPGAVPGLAAPSICRGVLVQPGE